MSPTNNIGMELPPPIAEQLPPASVPEQVDKKQEPQVSPFESAPTPSVALPASTPMMPATPVANASNSYQLPVASDNTQATGMTADDGDIIEKEWVNKAKAIVERTKDDPYKQSEELKLLKADYLEKRYNKTLKQST
ncbi:MAG TPA: hypothetical protein VFN31_03215 [Candidatus Saccharimonadales bacterium]|nr:hypothetical protein [Candidatus Saccharimonadales bacterium]